MNIIQVTQSDFNDKIKFHIMSGFNTPVIVIAQRESNRKTSANDRRFIKGMSTLRNAGHGFRIASYFEKVLEHFSKHQPQLLHCSLGAALWLGTYL